jgi:uncharacterized membrane protein
MPQPPSQLDVQQNRLWAAMSYLFVLCFLPLFLRKRSSFAQFHAKQGLTLLVAEILLWLAEFFLLLIPVIGWLIIVGLWVTLIVLAVRGVKESLRGERWEMPFFGEYAKEIKL